ncbi:hypothetical protein [Ferrovibrio sp.]|uniref:hypothetical protein n=1 Tax=Ferrovibrio sp. TaxID=1917215 RepID=UPI0035B0C780
MARKPDPVGVAKDSGAVSAAAARKAGKAAAASVVAAPVVAAHGAADMQRSRELLDFIALVMLAIKEEIEDLRQVQSRNAQAVTHKLMELGNALSASPSDSPSASSSTSLPQTSAVMAGIIGLLQGDDLANQRQQHVVNALRYVDDLIREHAGRGWEPRLSERAIGWGEGLLAGQTLEQVRAHFHHYLLDRGQSRTSIAAVDRKHDEVELF